MNKFKDLFISYGRRESLGFVGRLHQRLKLAGYDGWFDKVNIPDGDDYAQRINHGIESAHNFFYVMAPRCMTSPYCLIELEYARLLGKRVIPINQMVIFDAPEQELSAGDKQVLIGFYKFYNRPDQNIRTTQDVLNRSHTLIGKTDWLAGQEKVSDDDCQRLVEWAQPYENNWAKHDNLDYLKSFEFPIFGQSIDALGGVVERIRAVLERQKAYIYRHTEILSDALHWEKNQRATHHLLVGKERTAAEDWLLTEFLPPKQAPCQPSTLVCDFICEARKNAFNRMTDIFICYNFQHDKDIRNSVVQSLSRYAKTTWFSDRDIQKCADYERAIKLGIEQADNFFYFISPHSVTSDYCQKALTHALKYNKRIVPLLIAPTPESDIPEVLCELQCVDFTNNTCQADYDSNIDDILNILRLDHEYYEQHKVFLARALKWKAENQKSSFLLRGHNLENAQTWLRLNDKREQHPPLPLHHELITASEAAKGQLGTEVFISYSRKNGDFARKLNTKLQEAGKTTWFDQESISTGVDFEKEIFKGIDSADNFLFVLSPDAVESKYCKREVNYAAERGKRFITVLRFETDSLTMPDALRTINWIDFKETQNSFEKSFPELVQAIELDREHAYQHTVLQQRASDWAENNRSKDFLLNITACANAESWRDRAQEENKQPVPTQLQQDFIQDSRHAIEAADRKERKRRNLILGSVTTGLIIAIILSGFAFFQMDEAKEQAKIALIRQLSAQAVIAAKLPSPSNGSVDLALLLAAELFQIDETAGQDTLLRVIQNSQLRTHTHLYGHTDAVTSVAISPDGKLLASASYDQTVRLWDVETQALLGEPLLGHTSYVLSIAFSPDGKLIGSAGADKTVRLWDVETQAPLGEPLLRHTSYVLSIAFSPYGKLLASASADNTVRLWDVETHALLGEPLQGHTSYIWSVAFSPDGKLLASASYDNTVRLWDVETQAPLGEPLLGHTSIVRSVAFSPDGKLLASASDDNTVRLWDVETQAPLGEPLLGHTSYVLSIAFSPDEKLLASASDDNTVRLWDVETQAPLGEPLRGHTSYVWSVAFSPDGKHLASASNDNTMILWDVETQESLGETLLGHTDWVSNVAFSPNGKHLASASYDKTVRLWDVETQAPLGEPLLGHTSYVWSVAFSPDGKIFGSGGDDKTVRLWDVETQAPLGEPLLRHTSIVMGVAFSPDGKCLASASEDNTVRLWDLDTQTPLGEPLLGHTDWVWSVAFSPDGKLFGSGGADKTVRLWDVETQALFGKPLRGHTDQVLSIAFSPDGKHLASASYDNTVRLWDIKTQALLGEPLRGHTDRVWSVAFSPDGKHLASASDDKTVRLWDVKTQAPLGEPLLGHTGWVWSVAFSPDGKLVGSAGYDKTVRLWNVETHAPLGEPLLGHTSAVDSVIFSPNGKHLASASYDKTVRLWDVEMQAPLGEPLLRHTDRVFSVAFSPNGKHLASASDNKTVRLWDVEMQTPLGEPLRGHTGWVLNVAFSPDGKYLASAGDDKTVRLWDVETQAPIGEPLLGHTSYVVSVAFSPDGKHLASASYDQTVILWDVETQAPLGEPLLGHTSIVRSVAFSPDGKLLASASDDKTVRLWDVKTQAPLGEPLLGHTSYVLSVAFSPGGKQLASTSSDKTVILWDIDPQSWLNRACQIANRNLSQEEWRKYFGDEPHQKTCPELPKDTLGALKRIKQAEKLAREGKLDAAVKKFKEAQELDARFFTFDIEARAKQLFASVLREKGE